jgi:sulfur relay protein TusB/DsrH
MLFLISSAPDTREFKTSYRLAKEMNADVCLLQDAVYASRELDDDNVYAILDDMRLRGIGEGEVRVKPIDYDQLTDLMVGSDKVVGIF